MKLAEFIIKLIKQQNVKHVFGVPGDYNLTFLDFIEADPKLKWIGTCNELNASYAADGYARINGFGVLVTTHGVGELSVVNGIAGSYAENVPVLHIVGYPNSKVLAAELPIHHTLANGNKSNFLPCFEQITCSNSILTEHNCVHKILNTISKMINTKKPAIIGLPCDLLELDISQYIDSISFHQPFKTALPEKLLTDIKIKYLAAKNPILLLGSDINSFSWHNEVNNLIDKLNIPIAVSFMGKGVIDEQHPNYIGMYAADLSYPIQVQNLVEDSDCIISIGTRRTDFSSGGFSDKYAYLDNNLVIKPDIVSLGRHIYKNVHISSLLQRLQKELPLKDNHRLTDYRVVTKVSNKEWNQNNFWEYLGNQYLQPSAIVAAEAGTSLFGLLWQKLPSKVTFLAQILWASIGYTLPAIFGAVLAKPNLKGVLIIGDGSFLLTAQELSSIVRYNLNITVLLINNCGYTVERVIHGATQSYNDIPKWDYSAFARSVGIKHIAQVTSFNELEKSKELLSGDGPKFIECFFDMNDTPILLKKIAAKTK